jgi:fructose-1,6-bisphosphatase II
VTDSQRHPLDTEAYGADRLALHLLGATQAAALACVAWVGRGDKEAADAAAVAAMREVLGTVPGRGRVVIGEGEKDEAPMLYTGEEVGDGNGPAFELAIDPLEGTDYCASGLDGAISILAAGPRWSSTSQGTRG